MNKQEFISALREKLSNFPRKDIDERIGFYEEMINDKIDEGMSEEEAIASVGTIDGIYVQMLEDIPFISIIKEKIKPKKRMRGGKIALIVSTFPIWFSLLVTAFAVFVSLLVSLWSITVSFWAVFVAFTASSPAAPLLGILNIFSGNVLFGLVLVSMGLVAAGFAILTFYGCIYATKGSAILTKRSILGIKKLFIK